MKVFYSEAHHAHNPPYEVFDGGKREPYFENPDRMDRIVSALRKTDWVEFIEPVDFGLDPILAVHDKDYLNYLASCWTEWLDSDSEVAASTEPRAFLPSTFPLRRSSRVPRTLLGKGGYYAMDLSTSIVEGTYNAALASANSALSTANAIFSDQRSAFALCRPPGHHAGRDYAGGYCFINNASVAAHWLSAKGKVALLDIDYHAGNGTQDIFYERADVLTQSIHCDPDEDYPYFIGFAEENGTGAGLGFHKNYPLPKGTDDIKYLATLDQALRQIKEFAPRHLVLSIGMDIFTGDPLGGFKVTRNGLHQIGNRIHALNLPTAIIMEGGYANAELGENVVTVLENFK